MKAILSAMLATALACLAPLTAAAQTPTNIVFLSNEDNVASPALASSALTDQSDGSYAQEFTTEPFTGGIIPRRLTLWFSSGTSETIDSSALTVGIWRNDASASGPLFSTGTPPGRYIHLINPANLGGAGEKVFTYSGGSDLGGNIRYHIVVQYNKAPGDSPLFIDFARNEDTTEKTDGWDVNSLWMGQDGSWAAAAASGSSSPRYLRFKLEGFRKNSAATGEPSIYGIAQVGLTLTGIPGGIADVNGTEEADYEYQWFRYEADSSVNERIMSGGQPLTSPIYTLTNADLGKRIGVKALFTDDHGYSEERDGGPITGVVVEAAYTEFMLYDGDATSGPELTGTFTVGETIELDLNTVSDPDGRPPPLSDTGTGSYASLYAIEWGFPHPASEGSLPASPFVFIRTGDYTARFQLDHRQRNMFVMACWHYRPGGDAGERNVVCSQLYGPVRPIVGGRPVIDGAAVVGETLTALPGSITDPDGMPAASTFAYQWTRVWPDGSRPRDIRGAVSRTYTLASDDFDEKVAVEVSFTDLMGNAETRTSDPFPADETSILSRLPTSGPTLRGTFRVGQELIIDPSTIVDPEGTTNPEWTFTFWHVPAATTLDDIVDANYQSIPQGIRMQTGRNPVVTVSDDGSAGEVGERKAIGIVTYTDDVGGSHTIATEFSNTLVGPNNDAAGKPEIGGVARVGETLEALTDPAEIAEDITDADGLPAEDTYTYQWERELFVNFWTDIEGATESTYQPAQLDANRKVRVIVSFFDNLDASESLASDPYPSTGFIDPNVAATGEPEITGTAAEGLTLLVAPGTIADPDGLGGATYTYEWYRQDIDGSNRSASALHTGESYRLVADDAGKQIVVVANFNDADGYAESRESDPYPMDDAVAANMPATGKPEVSGVASEGHILMVSPGAAPEGIADGNGLSGATYTYEWYRQETDGTGRSASPIRIGNSYRLTAIDVGKKIVVIASFADDNTNEESRESDPYPSSPSSITNNVPATGKPEISGAANAGQTLTAETDPDEIADDIGDEDGIPDPPGYAYAWERGDTPGSWQPISGAASSAYVLVSADVGKQVRVVVSFTDLMGNSESLPSDPFPSSGGISANYLATGEPAISGTAEEGLTLTVAPGTIADPDTLTGVTYTYEWYRQETDGTGRSASAVHTGNSYRLVAVDVGKRIVVVARFMDADGNAESRESAPYPMNGAVAANVPATGKPEITGVAAAGHTLMASPGAAPNGIADSNGLSGATYMYDWYRQDMDGSNRSETPVFTGDSYVLVDADIGKQIVVTARFNDDNTNEENRDSDPYPMGGTVSANSPATGTPEISGVASIGETLTAETDPADIADDIADPDGLPAVVVYTYQWMREDRDGSNPMSISGATGSTYTLAEDDGGKKVRVFVRFADSVGGAESRMSGAYPGSGTVSAPPTGLPAVAGTVAVGETLTVDTTGIMDPNGLSSVRYGYRWQRVDADGSNPIDLTGTAAYLVNANDARKRLRVMVGFLDDDGNNHTLTSEYTLPVNVPAAGAPAVLGTAQVDEMLAASTAAITDANGISSATFAYQWQRADDAAGTAAASISGATLETYTPSKADDQGKFLRVGVTFTDDDGHEETRTSDWTTAVAKRANSAAVGAPLISGIVKAGQSLTAATSAISDVNGVNGVSFAYQWQRQNAPRVWTNVGGDSTIYPLTAADVGMRIRVRASFADEDDYSETVTSDTTAPITSATNNLATGAPAVAGTAKVGQVLSATPGTVADADGLASPGYVYQWQRGEQGAVIVWSDIAGAASSSYTLRAADEGKKIRVKTAFTDDGRSLEELPSAAHPAGSGVVEPADTPGAGGEAGSVFSIEGPSSDIAEPAAGSTFSLDFVVTLVRTAEQAADALSVDVIFTDGTAREGSDFTHSGPQRLVFEAGVSEKSISVTVNSDIVAEPSGETLVATLANPSRGASLGTSRSATVTIYEQQGQIYLEATEPLYTREDRTVSFNIRLSDFSDPAPVEGLMVAWRLVFDGAGAASSRSVAGRANEQCFLDSPCSGSTVFQAYRRTPTEPSYAVFDSELPDSTVIRLEVRPMAAAPDGSSTSAIVAVRPSSRLASDEAETVEGGWVVAGKETLITPYPGALVHAVAGTGHSVATSIVGGIWRRVEARRPGGLESRVTLGGRALDTQALSSGDAGRTVREVASLLGIETTTPHGTADGLASGYDGGIDDYRVWAGIPDRNRLASQTSFELSAVDSSGSGRAAIWGEFSMATRKSKPEENSSVESKTSDMLLGIDLPVNSETLYGLAFSRSSGESEYKDASADGTVETSLTTYAPYVLWTASSGSGLWGSVGRGAGTLEMTIGSREVETDVEMTMLAVGAKTTSSPSGGVEYAMRVDYFQTEMAVERVEGFNELSTEASRIRVALEGASAQTLDSGGASSSSLELGARMDSGDGDEGIGADIAANLRYLSPGGGLELMGRLNALLLHQQEGFSEWGAGLGISYTTGREGRGASLSLEPTWNVPRTGVAETMWRAQDLDGYATSSAGASMKARLGYGAGAMRDRALATLYGETETGGDSRRLRLGAELRGLNGPLERLSLDVYGEREEGQSSHPSDSVMLEGSLGF